MGDRRKHNNQSMREIRVVTFYKGATSVQVKVAVWDDLDAREVALKHLDSLGMGTVKDWDYDAEFEGYVSIEDSKSEVQQ